MLTRSTKFARACSHLIATALVATAAMAGGAVGVPSADALVTPEILTIGPDSGPLTGGDIVTITGQHFDEVTVGNGYQGVFFDDLPALVLSRTDTALTVVAPRGLEGPADVKLRTAPLDVVRAGGYVYETPQITSVTPDSGPTAGGTKITIKGTGFGFPDRGAYGTVGTPQVIIDSLPATSVVRVDEFTITAIVPAQLAAAREVKVVLYHSWDLPIEITKAAGYTYVLSPAAPILTSISPSGGPPTGGQTVYITGKNLIGSDTNRAVIRFGTAVATVTEVNPDGTSLYAVTPAGAVGKVDVSATTSDGRATLLLAYEYGATPVVDSVSPATGPVGGYTQLVITGSGFGTAGTPVVTLGGKKALCVSRESDTTLRIITPGGTLGLADMVITPGSGGSLVEVPDVFEYVPVTTTPTVSVVDPARGVTAGGTAITITGTEFGESGTPTVLIGDNCATEVVRASATELTAVTPIGSIGLKPVRVTTTTGTVTLVNGYDYIENTKVTPNFGPTTGGTAVTITGRGFGSSGTPTVTFGGVEATDVVRVSDTQITAVAPPNSSGAKQVIVTNADGVELVKNNAFNYKLPTITSVAPGAGIYTGGTDVVIIGTGFGDSGTPTVTFGGVEATGVVRISSTEIHVVTPAGEIGLVDVEVTPALGIGSATKFESFEYVETVRTPLIDDVSPTRGPVSGGIDMTVNGNFFLGSDLSGVTVVLGGVTITDVTVSPDGTQLIFPTPELGGGYQTLIVRTNEGEVIYRYAFLAVPPPTIGSPSDPCSGVSPRVVTYSGSNVVTVTGADFKDTGDTNHPGVTVGGVAATVIESTTTTVKFTVPEVPSGTQDIVITSLTGGGPITVTGCLTVLRPVTIAADDKTIIFGSPTPEFTFSVSGLISPDSVGSVTYTFTGVDGITYGPSTTPPVAAGRYLITPSDAVFSVGTADDYDITYIDGYYTIVGVATTVEAEDKEITYGDATPTFTAVTTGLLSGDSLSSLVYTFSGSGSTSYGPSTEPPIHAGTYTITVSDAVISPGPTDNYSVTYIAGTFTILRKPITVTADAQTKTYGDGDPALTYVAEGLVGTDTLSGGLLRTSGENVGTYAINQGTLTNGNNPDYDITYVDDDLTIVERHINITAIDKTKEYGDDDPELTFTVDNMAFQDKLSGALTRDPGENVGDYDILQGTLDASANYIIDSFTPAVLTITKRAITISVSEETITYGDPTPTFTAEVTEGSLVTGDSLVGATYSGGGTDAGEYEITPSEVIISPNGIDNYEITYVPGKLIIDPKPVYVTADDLSKTYGDADPTLTYTATGLIGDDTLSGDITRDAGENVGDYDITQGTLSVGPNYTIEFTDGTLTIDPKAITVVADDATKTYGDDDPEFTYTADGLVGDDTLSGSPGRASGEDVGDYTMNVGTLEGNSNYTITFTPGTLTINPKTIDVTADDQTKVYGDSDPTLTYSSEGLLDGDSLSGALDRDTGEDVGDYAITVGTITGGTNYVINSFTPGTLTITPRTVYVTADDLSKTYGDSDPTLTYTTDGLVGEDSLTGDLTRDAGEDVGDYAITQGTIDVPSTNYTLDFTAGTLTIDPYTVYVTADDKSKTYGDLDPALTYTDSGLLYDDVLTGAIDRDAGEDAGDYDITQGTLDVPSTNYLIDFTSGTLTIDPKTITVTGDDVTKTYGDPDPELTFGVDGLVGDDTLSGSPGRTTGEDVGDYPTDVGALAGNSNYTITFVPGKLTINPKTIDVTADDQTKVYGDSDPTLTYSSDGLLDGDSLSGALDRDTGEDVGDYAITVGTITGGTNYVIDTFTPGTLTITARPITVKADDQTITYGDPLPDNTVSVTVGSLVDPDAIDSATFTYGAAPAAQDKISPAAVLPSNAGTYSIDPSEAIFSPGSASNYDIIYLPGTLTINKRQITITVDDNWMYSGGELPTLTYTVGELPDGIVLPPFSVFIVGYTTPPTLLGDYTLDVDATDPDPNYEIVTVTGVLSVVGAEVLALLPDKGVYLGGTPFTIKGRGFGAPGTTARVTFGGLYAVEVLVIDSETIIGLTPPWELIDPDLPETVDVEIELDNGSNWSLPQAYTYLPIIPTPAMYSLYPAQGPTSGGTRLTITGVNLRGKDGEPARVYVKGVLALDIEVDETGTYLYATTPPGPEGTAWDVEVFTSDGATAFIAAFTYIPPRILSLSPTSGPTTGGTTVTIYGQSFGPAGTLVYIGGVPARVISWSPTQIVVVTGARAAGLVDVSVVLENGDTLVLPAAFQYTPPDSGLPETGGDPIGLRNTALAMLAIGMLAVGVTRRRRRHVW